MKTLFLLFFFSMVIVSAADATQPPVTRAALHRQRASEQPLEIFETDVIRYQKAVPRIHETLEAMKKAKASYIQDLTASPGNAGMYRTARSRRQMVGVYLFDMSYAADFDRKKQVMEDGEAVHQLLKALGFDDRKILLQYRKLIKEYGESTSKTLVTSYEKVLQDCFRETAATADGAALITEAAYGWLIEGLYVSSEIVAQQDYSPLFLYLINQHADSINPIARMFETISRNPELSNSSGSRDRLAVMAAISAQLKGSRKIGKKEIDAVRAIIGTARAAILK